MSTAASIITIDGPSGVGKSSVSRRVAAELLYTYLDTGAMYRGVGLYFHRLGIAADDEKEIAPRLGDIEITLFPAATAQDDVGVVLNGEDVSREVRTPEMSMKASTISALPTVRGFLTGMQRKIADAGKIVAEGRDMGTIVFPEARHKFFLEADARERCKRRLQQLRQQGVEEDEEKILKMILERDKNDRERAVAPLKKAEDATLINTTTLSMQQVVEMILRHIEQKGR